MAVVVGLLIVTVTEGRPWPLQAVIGGGELYKSIKSVLCCHSCEQTGKKDVHSGSDGPHDDLGGRPGRDGGDNGLRVGVGRLGDGDGDGSDGTGGPLLCGALLLGDEGNVHDGAFLCSSGNAHVSISSNSTTGLAPATMPVKGPTVTTGDAAPTVLEDGRETALPNTEGRRGIRWRPAGGVGPTLRIVADGLRRGRRRVDARPRAVRGRPQDGRRRRDGGAARVIGHRLRGRIAVGRDGAWREDERLRILHRVEDGPRSGRAGDTEHNGRGDLSGDKAVVVSGV